MNEREPDPGSDLDRAVAGRLARLRGLPVDTSRLDRAMHREVPPPETFRKRRSWHRPARALAASLAVMAAIGAAIISSAGGLAIASPAEMARFHRELVSGAAPTFRVDSIEAANKVLSGQSSEAPEIPDIPEDHGCVCCMRSIKGKKLSCVLVEREGRPVTMTVANAADMSTPMSPTVNWDGFDYHIQAFERLNMVMTQRGGRWICLIGELPAEKLMDLAARLQF